MGSLDFREEGYGENIAKYSRNRKGKNKKFPCGRAAVAAADRATALTVPSPHPDRFCTPR
jgi:hypothetical protein